MPDAIQPTTTLEATSLWEGLSPLDYLSSAAGAIGVGTGADMGWAPAPSGSLPPIGMAGGIPDPATLPQAELLEAMRTVLQREAAEALRYGGTLGYDGLRTALAHKSERDDRLSQSAENFLLTNGSSAAIDLICSTFINPGDVIITESPSYSGSLRTLRGHQARLAPVALDGDGLVPEDLERVLSALEHEGARAKLIYSVPDFHNPTGAYLSLERRRRLVEIAARHRVLIVEDDAYSDIYFGQRPLPTVYALAGGEGVLRVGTFSKTIATGLRVGWVQGRADFIAACNQMRFDMGGSPLVHRMLAQYISSGRWDEHVAGLRNLYAEKCELLSETLIDECEPYMRFQRPAGGFFLWLACAEGIDARRVVAAAAEEGVSCVPGHSFFLEPGRHQHVRLAYSQARLDEMPEAARRLRRAFERAAD